MSDRALSIILIVAFLAVSPLIAMLFSKIKNKKARIIIGFVLAVVSFLVLAFARFATAGLLLFAILIFFALYKNKDSE